jgi:hypothetical protein
VPTQKEAISGWSFQRSAISRQLSLYFKSLLLSADSCRTKTLVFGWALVSFQYQAYFDFVKIVIAQ